MNLFQGHPIETYIEDLNQAKNPETGDLVWLRPTRHAKREMDLSGILKDNWTLVTLTLPDDHDPAYPPTWFFTLLKLTCYQLILPPQ